MSDDSKITYWTPDDWFATMTPSEIESMVVGYGGPEKAAEREVAEAAASGYHLAENEVYDWLRERVS